LPAARTLATVGGQIQARRFHAARDSRERIVPMLIYPQERLALFIDGINLYWSARALASTSTTRSCSATSRPGPGGARQLLHRRSTRTRNTRRSAADRLARLQRLHVVTKPLKEIRRPVGRRKARGSMDIEIAVDCSAGRAVSSTRCCSPATRFPPPRRGVQRKGVRVSVVSTIRAQPPLVADELRRQADQFVDSAELGPHVARPSSAARPRRRRAADGPKPARPDRATMASAPAPPRGEPGRRLRRSARASAAFRAAQRAAFPAWHNAPVPSFGSRDARLLVVGLAPGLRGANRTGRPFTGDYAGRAALRHARPLRLRARRIPRAARGRAVARRRARAGRRASHERGALRAAREQAAAGRDPYLPRLLAAETRRDAEARGGRRARRVAHDATLAALGHARRAFPLRHGAMHALPGGRMLATRSTVRATTPTRQADRAEFEAVFAAARARLA
jgi:uncharacterized LabA/DUF88 family protein